MKCCETEKGCGKGKDKSSCGDCGQGSGCPGEQKEIVSFSLTANCQGKSQSEDFTDITEVKINGINDLEIYYYVQQEDQQEFLIFEMLVGITNLQSREVIVTDLENGVYETLEELVNDVSGFLQKSKHYNERLAKNLDIYFFES